MRSLLFSLLTLTLLAGGLSAQPIQGKVLSVDTESRSLELELIESSIADLPVGSRQFFRVGKGDLEIGYEGWTIRATAAYFSKRWNLEQVFPIDGLGAKAYRDVNHQLHQMTATMSRRKYLREGDYIPNFAMIDQTGAFIQIRQLKGKPFVLNFIFTRCTVPKMCPASSTRMAELQEQATTEELKGLNFVTISFDPAFDSPGVLRQYAEAYGVDTENFHLLTSTQAVVDDLLRQFGILTMEEDGTINHTMATFLIDANGRVAYRKEGASWTTEEFIEAAREL